MRIYPDEPRKITKEFKINDSLTLKLIEGRTEVYIKENLFMQCKFLMINIPIVNIEQYQMIDSIDEAAETLGKDLEYPERTHYYIEPETEFWGHCSNLQAWVENDYDTRLLHSNLALPLLKELAIVGDPIAKNVFNKEVLNRFLSEFFPVMDFLLLEGYLDRLSGEELDQIPVTLIIKYLEKKNSIPQVPVIKRILNSFLIPTVDIFEHFFSIINNGNIEYHGYDACDRMNTYIHEGVYNKFFQTVNWEKNFLVFLDSIQHMEDVDKMIGFKILLDFTNNNIIKRNQSKIEEVFFSLLNGFKFIEDRRSSFLAIDYLVNAIKGTVLLNKFFPPFLDFVEELKEISKYKYVNLLFKAAQDEDWAQERIECDFLMLLEPIESMDLWDKYQAFTHLVDGINGSLMMERFLSLIETYFTRLLNNLNDFGEDIRIFEAFHILIHSLNGSILIEKHAGSIEKMGSSLFHRLKSVDGWKKLFAFKHLYEAICELKSMEPLRNFLIKKYSKLYKQYQKLIEH
ncbi:MAG: hypothetical protein ACTSPN_10505 [Promethearchaeota archaeon]